MLNFKILKQSKKSGARLGILRTAHGEIETPALIPVATSAAVKGLSNEEAFAVGSQMLICNTYHLHLKPGEEVVKKAGGLHKFMNWPRPLMTDSGGFQVFSLGFGKDLGISKVIKGRREENVVHGQQPRLLKITDAGVEFTSFIDGRKIFLNPKISLRIQQKLGADIIFAFDECPPPTANYEYVKKSMERTHRWAVQSLKVHAYRQAGKSGKLKEQSLFGIVQGGRFRDLRIESAKFIGSLPFDGFGIGGEFGESKNQMVKMIDWVFGVLPREKPVHLLGIGHPEDIVKVIKAGVDTFDCVAPTRYARHGTAFTSSGRLDMSKSEFLRDQKPLDKKCGCEMCAKYSRSYLAHLFRAREINGLRFLTMHNLFYFHEMVRKIREGIKNGKL